MRAIHFLLSGMAVMLSMASPSADADADAKQPSVQTVEAARASLEGNFGFPATHLELAKAIKEQSQPERAFLICENARDRFGDTAFDIAFAQVFHGDNRNFQHERRKVAEAALKADPKNVALLRDVAYLDRLDGNFGRSDDLLAQAQQQAPDNVDVVEERARSLRQCGQGGEADQVIADWASHHPDSPLACEIHTAARVSDDSDTADPAIEAALKRFPNDGPLHLLHARWLHDHDRDSEAEPEFLASAKLSSDSAAAQIAAAYFLLTARMDGSRALPYYLAAYFLDPNSGDWSRAADHIRTIASEDTRGFSLEGSLTSDHPFATLAILQRPGELARNALWKAAVDDVPQIVDAAVRKLKTARDPQVETDAKAMATSKDPWKRAAAGEVLILRGAKLPEMKKLLADPSGVVWFRCSLAAIELNTDEARDAVWQQVIRNNRDPAMRSELADLVHASQ